MTQHSLSELYCQGTLQSEQNAPNEDEANGERASMGRRDRALRQIEDRIYRLTIGGPSDSRWQRLMNFVTESGYATAAVRRRLGLPTPLDTPAT